VNIEKTLLWNDISKILYHSNEQFTIDYDITVSTVDIDFKVSYLELLAVQSDYLKAIGDYTVLKFTMGLGSFIDSIYPYRDNIEVTIHKRYKHDGKKVLIVSKYKAIILNYDKVLDGTIVDNISSDSIDSENTISLELQLLDRLLEVMKTIQVSGIYSDMTNTNMMLSLFDTESKELSIDGKKGLENITIVKGDNTTSHKHIVIPSALHLINLPTYLQNKNHGVYRGDIGTYITVHNKKRSCFIYPLYSFDGYGKPVPKITIYSIPSNKFNLIESTWLVDGDNLSIVVGGNTVANNIGDSDYMNNGVGFRMPDANAIMKKPVEMTENGPVAKRRNLNYELVNKDRRDGVNYAPYAKPGSSPYKEYSKVLIRSGYTVSMTWRNGNADLIYPGMPCKYIFLRNGSIVSTTGQVIYKEDIQNREGIPHVRLVIFVKQLVFKPK